MRSEIESVNLFNEHLWNIASSHKDLLIVTSDEIIRGRSSSGEIIGSLAEYLIRSSANRPEGPAIS
jgi:nucleotide-binding universal stress UspA family protein